MTFYQPDLELFHKYNLIKLLKPVCRLHCFCDREVVNLPFFGIMLMW